MPRSIAASQLVVLSFALHGHPEAGAAERAAEYAGLVKEYGIGNGDSAIRRLLAWRPATIAEAARDVARPQKCQPIIDAGWFPAAIMLHTETGLRLNYEGKGIEAAFHWSVATMIARAPFSLERPVFLRAWYHALGHYYIGSNRDADAAVLLEQGHRQFPDDPLIALTLGRANEVAGTFSGGAIRPAGVERSADVGEYLTRAESNYRSVLAVDAGCAEARLRLGRVLQLKQQPEAALVELRRVAAPATAARLRYLAHLFIGDAVLHRGAGGDQTEARQEFERALEAWPGGQAAALSLARILHSSGRRGEAALLLEGAVARKPSDPRDPLTTYYLGDRLEERPLLEKVKAMAQHGQ